MDKRFTGFNDNNWIHMTIDLNKAFEFAEYLAANLEFYDSTQKGTVYSYVFGRRVIKKTTEGIFDEWIKRNI